MVAKPSFRCFGFGQPIISEIRNLVHHDHLYQVLPEFLKWLKYEIAFRDFDEALRRLREILTNEH